MSKKMKAMNGFMPMFPGMDEMPKMPFMPAMDWFGKKSDSDESADKWADFKSNAESVWEQMMDMQSSSLEASKEQWGKFFEQFLEMQELFAASLPDEVPALPGLFDFFTPPISPRAYMAKVREFQEMANAYAMERAAAYQDFCKKRQKKVKAAVTEAVKNIEEKAEKKKAEAKAEKKAEEKAEKKAEAKAEKKAEAKAEKDVETKEKKENKAKAVKEAAGAVEETAKK